MFVSPYHVQIDPLYFHIMKSSLLKGKQIYLLPLCLQKQNKCGLKKWGRDIGKNWYIW